MISPTFWRFIGVAVLQTVINPPFAFAEQAQVILSTLEDGVGPSVESTRANAPQIFNAIHSSMRQWGSSIQHNGMSIFPALVPQGTVLYHGDCLPSTPPHSEWLAFEIPHAELFTRGRCMPGPSDIEDLQLRVKEAIGHDGGHGGQPPLDPPLRPGWLQSYQTNRPLRLLYLDGMAAANTDFGPLDTQDLLLSGNFTRIPFDEWGRFESLCNLATEWNIDGFIRMEAGFEIMKCAFSDGLDLLSSRMRPPNDSPAMIGANVLFEYIRDVSVRYNGIDASRVVLDYSSMVSAYFYPANLTNPDPKSNDPRLVLSTHEQLSRMRSDMGNLIAKSDPFASTDWQGVVDMIQKRYSDRLLFMATGPSPYSFLASINELLNLYIDYEDLEQNAVDICSEHYLLPTKLSSSQDYLIDTAIRTVTRRICDTLFTAREILFEVQQETQINRSSKATAEAAELIQTLIEWLDWPDWKFCGICPLDQVCFVAVFPFGSAEDHFHPGCKNITDIGVRDSNYWVPQWN